MICLYLVFTRFISSQKQKMCLEQENQVNSLKSTDIIINYENLKIQVSDDKEFNGNIFRFFIFFHDRYFGKKFGRQSKYDRKKIFQRMLPHAMATAITIEWTRAKISVFFNVFFWWFCTKRKSKIELKQFEKYRHNYKL